MQRIVGPVEQWALIPRNQANFCVFLAKILYAEFGPHIKIIYEQNSIS